MADELINRNKAIEAIEFGITYLTVINKETGELSRPFKVANDELLEAVGRVKQIPAVDAVEVRHGRWKIKTVREYDLSYGGRIYVPEYVCGCCGHYYESYVRGDEPIMPEDADFPMYCEQCGARMDGKDKA